MEKLRKLYPYQQKSLNRFYDKDNMGLFFEMRLGKTIVTLRWLAGKSDIKKILVICPLSVIDTWEKECKKENMPCFVALSKGKKNFQFLMFMDKILVITNYENLRTSSLQHQAIHKWDAVILDESTKIRNVRTKISRLCCNQFADVKYKAILTGCPNPESELDFFQQMKFLTSPAIYFKPNFFSFKDMYFHQTIPGNWEINYKFRESLKDSISHFCEFLSRKECGMGSKKVYEDRMVELPSEQRKAYDIAESQWAYEDWSTQWAIVVGNFLHQMTGGFPKRTNAQTDFKIKEIIYLLKTELKGQKVVIWCNFLKEIWSIKEALQRKSEWAYPLVITGATDLDQRRWIFDKFSNRDDYQILIAQNKTVNLGVDLSAASVAIYYSNSWENEVRLQTEDRIIHPEKKEPVLILNILAKDTIDEDIWASLQAKKVRSSLFAKKVFEHFRKRTEKKYGKSEVKI